MLSEIIFVLAVCQVEPGSDDTSSCSDTNIMAIPSNVWPFPSLHTPVRHIQPPRLAGTPSRVTHTRGNECSILNYEIRQPSIWFIIIIDNRRWFHSYCIRVVYSTTPNMCGCLWYEWYLKFYDLRKVFLSNQTYSFHWLKKQKSNKQSHI